jgi:hypothetical protein
VPDDETGLDWIFPADDMKIGAADSSECDANHCFPNSGLRAWDFVNSDIVYSVKNKSFHLLHLISLLHPDAIGLAVSAQFEHVLDNAPPMDSF